LNLLLVYVGFALTVSFVCSLLEATLLSAGRGMLSEEQAAGRRGAAILLHLKQERIDDSISAILILNTMANTLGATLAGAQAARVFGSSVIGVFSGVLTLLILVLSEIIPKTLGATYWKALAKPSAYVLRAMVVAMKPIVLPLGWISRILTPSTEQPKISRAEIEVLAEIGRREGALDDHPWREWAEWATTGDTDASGQRLPGATSRWNRGKDLSWEPLRVERVAEVAYDHLQGDRFRHATTFKRWRPDKPPEACRYDQLEATAPFLLARIFGDRG